MLSLWESARMFKICTLNKSSSMQKVRMFDQSSLIANWSIDSVVKLKEIVEEFKTGQRKGILKEEESHAIQYFTDFFNELESLKALKGYFDDRIYKALQEYFYDDKQFDNLALDDDRDKDVIKNTLDKVKAFEPWSEDLGNGHNVENNITDTKENSKIKINESVLELYKINTKWDKLFTEATIDAQNFDDESKQKISHLENYKSHENILRLVPDLLKKSENSVNLAKTWWIYANKFYDILPKDAQKHTQKRIDQLEDMINKLNTEIVKLEKTKSVRTEDVSILEKRNNRVHTLREQLEKVEEMKNFVLKMYRTITNEKLRIQLNIVEEEVEGEDREILISQSVAYEARLMKLDKELSVLDYQHSLVKDDYHLELEVQPEMIRYLGAQRQKVEDIKLSLEEKRARKNKIEQELDDLKHEANKMKSGTKQNQVKSKSPGLLIRSNTFTTEKSTVKKENANNVNTDELNKHMKDNGDLQKEQINDSRSSSENTETGVELSDEEF